MLAHSQRVARYAFTLSALVALLISCGSDKKNAGVRNAAPTKQPNSGDQTQDPAAGTPTGTGGNGSGDAKDSLALFQETVYPLVRDHCVQCHESSFSPFFAANDAAAAHKNLIELHKVDLDEPSKSRLVLRLAQDKHYCWTNDCDADAAQMQAAITKWSDALKAQVDKGQSGAAKTSAKLLGDAVLTTVEFKNPANVFVFEAEAGTLKAPFAQQADVSRSGGTMIQTAAGAGNQLNAATARNQATLGTALYTFNVTQAGTYQLWGLVNAPAAANASFYTRVDNAATLNPWIFEATGADYKWDRADGVAGMGTPTTFTLAAGSHTLEIRQRQEQAKLDMLVLTSNTTYDPMTAKVDGSSQVQILSYDISKITGVANATFQIEVRDYSANGYLFKNPKIITDKPIQVKDLRLLVNDLFLAQHATYTVVDKVINPPGDVLSSAAMVVLKDKGTTTDEFSFSFGTLAIQK